MINNESKLYLDSGPYHMETSPLIYSAIQWTGFLYDRDLRHERFKTLLPNRVWISKYFKTFETSIVLGFSSTGQRRI